MNQIITMIKTISFEIDSDNDLSEITIDGLTYTLTMEDGEVIVSGGEKDLITAYIEYKDAFMRVQNKQLVSQILAQSSVI